MATPPGKVPIMDTVKAGYAFLQANWRTTAPAALVGAAVYTGAELLGAGENAGAALLGQLALLAFGLAFTAFCLRLALRKDGSGMLGMQVGKDEGNLLGATLVVGFFMFILVGVAFVLFLIVTAVAAQQSGLNPADFQGDPTAAAEKLRELFTGPSAPVLIGFGLIVILVLLLLSARLSLVSAATIGERKLMAFTTWKWTEGNALRILAASFLAVLPLAFATGFILAFFGAALGVNDASFATGPLPQRVVLLFLAGVSQYAVLSPVFFGLLAHLYQGLRPAAPPPQV